MSLYEYMYEDEFKPMNNITYSKKSIANPSNREQTDRELYLEAKALLKDVLFNYKDDSEYSLLDREHLQKKIQKFLDKK